ncbi:hypothetical protein BRARA_D02124 [Brassica rapa]|uniref:DUF223 domain-containing protein n=1 Tax=Brassica campestris TaxID=3711 RepID=A0A397ZPS6_BRACM|nr:hypothetical protein BRARA_D02124 [Brassica rapa]
MPLEYTPISQLNSSQKEWKIRVLVSRIWDFHSKHKPEVVLGMEAILVDEKGDRIQASLKQKLIKKYKRELKEGAYLDVMNFEVLGNNGDYRGTTHPYKINFIWTTYVKTSEKIPNLSRFNLSPFPDILSQSNVDDVFIDILGEIVGMGEITERNYAGNSTKLLDIQLRDLSETIIECTLWEKHAEDLHSYVKNNKTGPVILLGSLMRTKRYNGKISVQNSRFSTKLFLNEDIDEISVFKKGMANADTLAPFTVSPMPPPTRNKKDVESFPLSCWKTIDQITSTMEESTCVTFASIVAFQKECRWWYLGCKGCCSTAQPYFNPVTEQIEPNKYSCDTCEKDEITTILRYKVQVKVADHTGSTCFLLFDREVIQLIHKSAYELLEQQVQFNREGEIPQELMDLEGRKFAWIIRVKGTEKNYKQPSFNVIKLTDKPEVIHRFQDNVTMEVATHSDLAISSSTCSAMQVENTSSEANDNDLPSSSPMTPTTKRQRSHNIDDEGIQESSTKPKGTSKMAKAESGTKVRNLKKESTKAKH